MQCANIWLLQHGPLRFENQNYIPNPRSCTEIALETFNQPESFLKAWQTPNTRKGLKPYSQPYVTPYPVKAMSPTSIPNPASLSDLSNIGAFIIRKRVLEYVIAK